MNQVLHDLNLAKHLDRLYNNKNFKKFLDEINYNIENTRERRNIHLTYIQAHGAQSFRPYTPTKLRNTPGRQGQYRTHDYDALIDQKLVRLHDPHTNHTPYKIRESGQIILNGQNTDTRIDIIDTTSASNSRINGFYFPQLKGHIHKRLIRFNPRNLGRCIGGCVFCQRAYNLPTSLERETRYNYTADELIESISRNYPSLSFSEIDHALVVTEFYGNNRRFLDLLKRLKFLMRENAFHGAFSSLSTELVEHDDIYEYADIVDYHDYCLTLECFDNRDNLMSPKKSVSQSEIQRRFSIINKLPFKHTLINYIIGLDDLDRIDENFSFLYEQSMISHIGLNVFTPYTDRQEELSRFSEFGTLTYISRVNATLHSLSILPYLPAHYERFPIILEKMERGNE